MVQAVSPRTSFCNFTNYSPCQLISGIAQKIADFVTGIFTTIANFVKYCLCMSAPAAAPAPANPAPVDSANSVSVAAAAPTIPPAPTPAPRATTSTLPAPAATTTAPAIDPNLIESGKQLLLGLCAQDRLPEQLDPEVNGRRAFATVLIHASMILPLPNLRLIIVFVRDCNVGPDYRPMAKLFELKHSLGQSDESLRREALRMFVSGRDIDPHAAPAVAAFVRDANAIRERFTQDPIFCAAADAARAELSREVL